MTELLFLHSARRLMLVDTCIKFREYSLSGFQVIEWTRFIVMNKVQREITQKVYKEELPLLHSARHLMLINICIKFREYSLSGFQVIEWTRFVTDRQTDGQTDARGKTICLPTLTGGDIINIVHSLAH